MYEKEISPEREFSRMVIKDIICAELTERGVSCCTREECRKNGYEGCELALSITDKVIDAGFGIPMPCFIGDPIYQVICMKSGEPSHILETECVGFHYSTVNSAKPARSLNPRPITEYIVVQSEYGSKVHINRNRLNKDVFLNKEQADAEMKRLRLEWNEKRLNK